jgi:hypothetical protein
MKKILIYGLVLALIAASVGFYLYNKPHQNMNRAKSDLSLSATELFTDFENDEANANTKYLDKIVEVQGIVKEISTDETGTTSVTLESGSDMFGVICQMDNLTDHKRTAFQKGEEVTLKGICTGVLMDVVLVRCIEV